MRSRSASSAALAALLAACLLGGPATAATPRLAPDRPAPPWLLYGVGGAAEPAAGSALPDASEATATRSFDAAARLALSTASPDSPRNPRRALLLSLLLPGAGELYLGHRGRATGFFVSEGLIWANFAAWEFSGHLRQNDYIEQAQLGAGVGVDSGTDDYWRLVGQYARSSGTGPDAYEEALRREARTQYPDDPAAQDQYVAQRLPTGDRAWSWSASDLQARFTETRKNANRAFDRAKYSFGFAILNRLVSALDTQILHRSRGAESEGRATEGETRILTAVTADGGGALLIQRRF